MKHGNKENEGENINVDSFENSLNDIENNGESNDLDFHNQEEGGDEDFFQQDTFDGDLEATDLDDESDDMSDFDGQNHSEFEEDEREEEEGLSFDESEEGSEEEEIQEEEEQDDSDELKRLNKILNTDYSSLEEAKKELKKEDDDKSFDEQEQEYSQNENSIGYLNTLLGQSDKEVIKEERMLRAGQQNRDLKNPETLEEIEDEIEDELDAMIQSGTLRMNADNVRKGIKEGIDQLQSRNNSIDEKKKEIEDRTNQAQIENLENEFASLFKNKKFLGVDLDQETVKKAYKNARQKDYFEKQIQNPKQAARLALMLELEDKITRRSSNPSPAEVARQIVGKKGRKNSNRQNMSAATRSGSSAARRSSVTSSGSSNVDLWLQ